LEISVLWVLKPWVPRESSPHPRSNVAAAAIAAVAPPGCWLTS